MTTFGYDSFFLLPGNQTGKADGRYEGEYINELHSWSAPASLLKPVFSPRSSYLSFLHKHPSKWSFTMPTAWRKE